MADPVPTGRNLPTIWGQLEAERGDLITRCEEYAKWTLPYICQPDHSDGVEQDKGSVVIGARLVNHLANRVVDVMFPPDRPFFQIGLSPRAIAQAKQQAGDEALAEAIQPMRETMMLQERIAMHDMKLVSYRTKAVEAIKHLIITGNALVRRLKDESRVVYGVRDYVIRRDIRGEPIQIILKDSTHYATLDPSVKAMLGNGQDHKGDPYHDDSKLDMYTMYEKKGKRWHTYQSIETVNLEDGPKYTEKKFPCIALTWSLGRGDHYGRGLVEDNAAIFHSLDKVTEAMIDLFGIAADVKFLVNPGSTLDVVKLNDSPRGSYHAGMKDDVSIPELDKINDARILAEAVAKWERELAQTFLMSSSGVRDAERVTAEEIRFYARELEASFGGLYSRLSLEWQHKEAVYAVDKLKLSLDSTFDVTVTTGLETLTREGQLDNFRMAMADLQLMEGVPEDMRRVINPLKVAQFIFQHRRVDFSEFLYTQAEMQQQRAQQQAELDAARQQETANQVATEAGKQAVKE